MSRRRISVGIVPPTCVSPSRSTDTGRWVVTYFRTASGRFGKAGAPTVGTAAVVVVSICPAVGAAVALFMGAPWPVVIAMSEGAGPAGDRKRVAIQPAPPP